jgi:hypothetical protein
MTGRLGFMLLGCVCLCLAACEEDASLGHGRSRFEIGFEPMAAYAAPRFFPDGSYLLDLEKDGSGMDVATMEVEFAGAFSWQHEYLTDPVSHLGMHPGSVTIRIDSIEPPQAPHYHELEVGTLFGLGVNAENPLVVEFFDAGGLPMGAPQEIGFIPNNSAHPEDIEPIRIALNMGTEFPAEIRLSLPNQTFMPVVFLALGNP